MARGIRDSSYRGRATRCHRLCNAVRPGSSDPRNRLVATNCLFHRSTMMEQLMERPPHSKRDPLYQCSTRIYVYICQRAATYPPYLRWNDGTEVYDMAESPEGRGLRGSRCVPSAVPSLRNGGTEHRELPDARNTTTTKWGSPGIPRVCARKRYNSKSCSRGCLITCAPPSYLPRTREKLRAV